jgi:hypothetical protein
MNSYLRNKLASLDNQVQVLANRMVPLVIARGKREAFAKALRVQVCEVSNKNR